MPGFREFGFAIENERREPLSYEPKVLAAEALPYDVEVRDGLLEIEFQHGASNHPKISALEIERISEEK